MVISDAMKQLLQVWIGSIIILSIYSFLYNDNKIYRIVLNLCIGITAGYALIVTWKQVLGPKWWDPMWSNLAITKSATWIGAFFTCIAQHPGAFAYWLFLGVLGSLWYFQASRKYLWLARIPIGLTVGMGAGVVFKAQLLPNVPQMIDSCRPLLSAKLTPLWPNGQPWIGSGLALDPLQSFSNIVFVVGVAVVMVYFFFSFDQTNKAVSNTASLGRWLLMILFGGFFGNTIMSRMAVLLQNIQFMQDQWAPAPISFALFGRWWSIASGWVGLIIVVLGAVIYTVAYVTGKPTKPSGPDTPQTEEELAAKVTR